MDQRTWDSSRGPIREPHEPFKGSSGSGMDPGLWRVPGLGVYGQSVGRRLNISLVFQAEVYEILLCVHESENLYRPDK